MAAGPALYYLCLCILVLANIRALNSLEDPKPGDCFLACQFAVIARTALIVPFAFVPYWIDGTNEQMSIIELTLCLAVGGTVMGGALGTFAGLAAALTIRLGKKTATVVSSVTLVAMAVGLLKIFALHP